MNGMTIGKIAKQSGVTVETLRFYEKQGLLTKPRRSASGYRLYDATTIPRVQFIIRAKRLGFALTEIMELLDLRRITRGRCAEVRRVALHKIKDIDQKLFELQRIQTALQQLIERCDRSQRLSECPILDALSATSLEIKS